MILLPLALLAGTASAEPMRDIVPEDYFSLDTVGTIAVSRTGANAVFVRYRWDAARDGEKADLWLLDTRSRTSTRLTHAAADAWSPTISADDRWVYYLSEDGDDVTQVFRIRLDGTASQQVTRSTEGIGHYELPAEGNALWYSTHATVHTDDPWDALRDRWADVRYPGGNVDRSTLHRLDLDTWRDEVVHTPDAYVMDFSVSPRERHVAMLTAPDDDLVTHEGWSEVRVLTTEDGTVQTLEDDLWRGQAPSPYGWLLGLDWSSDDRALAFRVDFDGYPGETFVAEFAGGEPEIWKLPRPREVTPMGDSATWVPGKRDICYLAAEQARSRMVCFANVRGGEVGKDRTFPQGNAVIRRYAFSQDGRDVLAVAATPDKFTELYRFPARGRLLPLQLTNLNPHTASWRLPQLETVRWTAPDGTEVEGILETPPGWTKEMGPLPMVVQLHGGPTSHTPFARRFRIYGQTAFAAKGWALLSPNYRGSIGYGDDFLVDLVGHENEVEVADILSGVDAMVASGVADPDRLAVMGWSNGGYLTNALITHTDRFKAASSGAGVVDMTMQWALEDTPGHVINFLEGQPWDKGAEMQAASPLYDLDKVVTPTVIHMGEFDPRVPAAHAYALYRGLSLYRRVPSELVIYPGAGHSVRSWTHRATKLAWDHAWLSHHVLGDELPPGGPVSDAAE
jgi:dipeptidyl aminopeptidase/acylaminoacyl peptidase